MNTSMWTDTHVYNKRFRSPHLEDGRHHYLITNWLDYKPSASYCFVSFALC